MPSKQYQIWLTETLFIAVEIVMAGGRVVSFCVRLMTVKRNGEQNIARYDTAHGVPHRDVLDRHGNVIQKIWFPDASFEAVLNHALDDFKLHHAEYEKVWKNK
jgi:hypothetical protein